MCNIGALATPLQGWRLLGPPGSVLGVAGAPDSPATPLILVDEAWAWKFAKCGPAGPGSPGGVKAWTWMRGPESQEGGVSGSKFLTV